VVVTDGDGGAVLIDAGAKRWPDAGQQVIAPALWHEGVRRIDAVVLSHRDDDHVNGLADLAERFGIGCVVVPVGFDRDEEGQRVIATARTAGLPVETVGAGATLSFHGGATWEVLHPNVGVLAISPSPNDRSLVVRLPLPSQTRADDEPTRWLMIPGDIERGGIALSARAIRARDWSGAAADVLLAPHHGGPTLAGTATLIGETGASVVIASNDRPRWPAVLRGARGEPVEVWQTLRYGAIRVTVAHGEWRVTPWIDRPPPAR
jgi:competence protein ComEC